MGKKALRVALDQLNSISADEGHVVVATGKFLGEGFDDPRLDTLFLTMPISWRGTIAQYVGRLHRLYEGKRVVQVYDYADLDVPMLSRMFDRRCAGYEAVGYSILLPTSALPGWPVDVPLPVDAQWKQDYAASVRRLIRDGVDQPLAQLFVHAARPASTDAQRIERARSASEAFFYRRLESIAAREVCSNSTPHYLSRLTTAAKWKSIFSVSTRGWLSRLMACSIFPRWNHGAEIDERMHCFNSTAFSSCASLATI